MGRKTATSTTPWRWSPTVACELRFKHELPNYGVFDEKRVFTPGPLPDPVIFRGMSIGLPICEDIWYPDCVAHLARAGAQLLLVPNGSPFEVEKFHQRLDLARQRVSECGPASRLRESGRRTGRTGVRRRLVRHESRRRARPRAPVLAGGARRSPAGTSAADGWRCDGDAGWREEPRLASVYNAMVLGLRDYVRKNGFRGVVLGLSGGIDSALTAAVAVDALGADRVRGVRLPSRFTSRASLDDAAESAAVLGMRLETLSIESPVETLESTLAPLFVGRPRDVTEENLQARARGLVLMALSNKFGELLVTTGNKSEMSVGYATLYGDMCGGYSVLKDVYKTEVYALSRWRNQDVPDGGLGPGGQVIPDLVADQGADRRAAAKPDGPGLAPAVRGARCDPRRARRG